MKPLFNSAGHPIAYQHGEAVFTYDGRFLGRLDNGRDVFTGTYRGTVVDGNRLLYDPRKAGESRPAGEVPFSPGMPYRPWGIGPRPLPDGCRDLPDEK
jgi:hypothetical protein